MNLIKYFLIADDRNFKQITFLTRFDILKTKRYNLFLSYFFFHLIYISLFCSLSF